MSVPKAVKEAEEKAIEEHKKVYSPEGKTDDIVKAPEKKEDITPAPEQTAPTEVIEQGKAPEGFVSQEDYNKLLAEHATMSQAHTVLKGKYNSEVPALHAEIKALKEEKPSVAAPAPNTEKVDELVGKFKEDFGEESGQVITELIKSSVQAATAPLLDKISQLEAVKPTPEPAAATSGKTYGEILTELVPDWHIHKADPRFAEYLKKTDPKSGKALYELAIEAQNGGDAVRVAHFYNEFKNSVGIDTGTGKAPEVTKEDLISPAGGAGPAATGEGEIEPVSAQEIQAFTNDIIRGVFKNKPDEQAKIQAKIDAAIAAGKVIG